MLTIKDPFDRPHNPGRLKIESKDFFLQKFKEAMETMTNAKDNDKLSNEGRQDKVRSLFETN